MKPGKFKEQFATRLKNNLIKLLFKNKEKAVISWLVSSRLWLSEA